MSVTNLPISGPYPGLQYIPASPETGGIYHEEREINGVMYRAINAQFANVGGSLKWSYYQSGGAGPLSRRVVD